MKILCNTTHSDEFDIDTVYTKEFEIKGTRLVICESDKKEIYVPDGVTEISCSAFGRCENAETIYLPDSVTELNAGAFMYSHASKIHLSSNIDYIPSETFMCSELQEIEIPHSVREIGPDAFNDCKFLKRIIIPDSVQSVYYSAFADCKNLEYVRISNSMRSIDSHMFSGCESLVRVEISGNSLNAVREHAFEGCTSLTKISFPDSLKVIEYGAFEGCYSLVEVSIPNNVKFKQTPRNTPVFKGCNSLELPPEIEYLRTGIPKPPSGKHNTRNKKNS